MAKIQTRARTVDMLGRQQIAGLPSAASELFKNAHDAYATQASIDYFEAQNFVVVRDNGVGMTYDDFEQKWLVLGTESKVASDRSAQYRPPQMEERPITGEKGIGRLAIALLGKQVLVLTRAIREDGLHDLVVALIHWGLFELPGVNLESIDIPMATFPGGTLPTADQLSSLRKQLTECAKHIATTNPDPRLQTISAQIDDFYLDPIEMNQFFASRGLDSLTLEGQGTGTHFFIGPANPVIRIELATEEKESDYSFRRQILGFCDQTFGDAASQRIATSFRRWIPGDLAPENLLNPDDFFTKTELYDKTDHLLAGEVDAYGQFKGYLKVYNKRYEDLVIPWPESKGRQTQCGPFDVTFGYLMGRAAESTLPPENFDQLNGKLNNLGGMYVYRDGIRILPYGDYSYDWLEVEKRRNKGAGYYFFSFRRMFGAVMLTREQNHSLHEKAGREGFQTNEAYRNLRDILMNLLIQLAADFFRKDGTNTQLFESTQAEMRRRAEALSRQQKRSATKRKSLQNALSSFANAVNSALPEVELANLRRLTQSRMEAASQILDQDRAASSLIRAEQEALTKLSLLREKYTHKRPAGTALTKDLSREWDGYVLEKRRLDSTLFGPFEEEISRTLGTVAKQARIYVDQRKRLEERIGQLADERKRELEKASKQANDTASETRLTVLNITEKARLGLDQTIRNIQADLNRTDLSALDPEAIETMRRKWEDELTEIESRHRDALMAARDMLSSLAESLKTSGAGEPAEMMEALEERMLALEEQTDQDFEMVQLGLAVAIINHEFAASIKRVRHSVQELGQISRKSEALRPLYESIRTNFEHLDGHLNLFTPLQRRLYRTAQKISGKSIRNYVNDLFSNRLDRHKISIECTNGFLSSQIECYPSTIYPAIINLVDNAIFWLSSLKDERKIRLDAENGALLISNNGPLVEERDRQRIFERGFSRKPGGRGLGLFISARALQAEKMALTLGESTSGFNTTFRISIPDLALAQ